MLQISCFFKELSPIFLTSRQNWALWALVKKITEVWEQPKSWYQEEWPRMCWNWNLDHPHPRWFAASPRAGAGGRVLGWWCPCHDSKAWVVLSYLLITLILSPNKLLSPNNSYLPITAVFQSGPQCLCINPAMQWSWCCPEERMRGWERFPSLHCPCLC